MLSLPEEIKSLPKALPCYPCMNKYSGLIFNKSKGCAYSEMAVTLEYTLWFREQTTYYIENWEENPHFNLYLNGNAIL